MVFDALSTQPRAGFRSYAYCSLAVSKIDRRDNIMTMKSYHVLVNRSDVDVIYE